METSTLEKQTQVLAVMSAKGGVGKSVVTGLLAVALRRQGLRVGIVDADLTGSSITHLFGLQREKSNTTTTDIRPLETRSGIKIAAMTMFLEHETAPLVWRAPMLASAFKLLLSEIAWGELDYLLIDAPSGTSDVPNAILHLQQLDGVLVVSTPNSMATSMAKKCITMAQQMNKNVVGIIENMASLNIADGEEYAIYGRSHSNTLVQLAHAPLLAQLPVYPQLALLCDAGLIEEVDANMVEMVTTNVVDALKVAR